MQKSMRTFLLGLMLSALLLAQPAFALDVYVTKNGKKYHKKDSRFLKGKDVEKLTLEEAEARGYKPSSEMVKILKEQTAGDDK